MNHPHLVEKLTLIIEVHTVSTTAGPHYLVSSLLFFGSLPKLSIPNQQPLAGTQQNRFKWSSLHERMCGELPPSAGSRKPSDLNLHIQLPKPLSLWTRLLYTLKNRNDMKDSTPWNLTIEGRQPALLSQTVIVVSASSRTPSLRFKILQFQ